MSTILFDSVIFGPVKSRRLGISLGINLLPVNCKMCNFNCIYCECGLSKNTKTTVLPTRKDVRTLLENKLCDMMLTGEKIDVMTFAGNGEPTLHPEFAMIVSDVLFLKEAYFPTAKIAVLSNATMLHKTDVVQALNKVDMNILKLDSAVEETYITLNQPNSNLSLETLIKNIKKLNGKFILQTMFIHGTFNGIPVDNTSEYEVEKWLEVVRDLKPQMVMVYTIEREPAVKDVKKVSAAQLQKIANEVKKLGIKVQITG